MLDLANVAISLVKKTIHCYFEEKNIDYLWAHCINDDIPIIGVANPNWINILSVVNEHYQFYRLSETAFVVYGKLTVREVSDNEEHNDMIVNVTFSCKMAADEIIFTSVHMSHEQGNPFVIETKSSELKRFYREAIEGLYDVFVEFDNINNTFEYNMEEFNALFETDTRFVNIDQMFWFMCSECVHPDDTEKMDIFRNIDIEKRIRNNDCKIKFEVRIKNKLKEYKWVEMVVIMFPNSVFKLNKMFYLIKDIDEKKKLELENKINARKDSLTGILNRRYSEAMMKVAIRENKDYSALAIIDIDNFKKINDTFGHMSGDDVLKRIVDIINASVSDTDILGRLGGDEFILFIRNRDSIEEIQQVMEEVINNSRIVHKEYNTEMDVHVSIGVVAFKSNTIDFEELYKISDEALYEVKNANKNSYCLRQI